MKTLYLVRHAKSDWGNEKLHDIDRPLNTRGYHDAHLISSLLKKRNEVPDVIFTSDAIRALSTAVIFIRSLALGAEYMRVKEKLYEASADELVKFIGKINDNFNTAAIIGHNPGLTEAVNRLCNANIDNIPTTGIVCLDFDIPAWKNAGETDGTLRYFDFPKKHMA